MSLARNALKNFFQQNRGQLQLPTSVVFFRDTSTQTQPVPTRDGNRLVEAMNSQPSIPRIVDKSQGVNGAQERLDLAMNTLGGLIARERKDPGRKLLIWMSPGWPLLTMPGMNISTKEQRFIFSTIVALSWELRESRITLYSVDPLGLSDVLSTRTRLWEGYVKGVPSSNKAEGVNLALQVLATQSGGRALNSSNDVAGLIASCLLDAKAYYTLSFDAPPADHSNEYHSIEIKVDKPDLKARTRTGYYAQPYQTTGR